MQSYWPKSQDICIAALPCISTPKPFRFMGKANFLPGKSRKKNKMNNFFYQHFLLDKFTTFPTRQPTSEISAWEDYSWENTPCACGTTQKVLHNTWTEKSLSIIPWLNKKEIGEYSYFSCKVVTWPEVHILTYHESHFTDRETEVITFFLNSKS